MSALAETPWRFSCNSRVCIISKCEKLVGRWFLFRHFFGVAVAVYTIPCLNIQTVGICVDVG
jgi:hypothetical protein